MARTSKQPDVTGGAMPAAAMAMMAVNPLAAKAWMDMMSEGARFMTERFHADLETQQALMACKTPAEVMEVQSRFIRTAMEQYAAQGARVMGMMVKATQDIAEDAKSGHSRGYDDVPV